MNLPVRRLTLMAGAIDDDCLNTEFLAGGGQDRKISVLASMKDTVLSMAFPLGNFFAGILTRDIPGGTRLWAIAARCSRGRGTSRRPS